MVEEIIKWLTYLSWVVMGLFVTLFLLSEILSSWWEWKNTKKAKRDQFWSHFNNALRTGKGDVLLAKKGYTIEEVKILW